MSLAAIFRGNFHFRLGPRDTALQTHELAVGILTVINGYLDNPAPSLRKETIVDATLIDALSQTTNPSKKSGLKAA